MAAIHENSTRGNNFDDFLESYVEWNKSRDSKSYDYYDPIEFSFDASSSTKRLLIGLFLTCVGIFTLNGILLLLTALTPQCRSISSNWYLYHLDVIKILDNIVVLPLRLSGLYRSTCYALMGLSTLIELLHSISIIFINTEIVFTVISPRSCWRRSSKKRFVIAIVMSWIVCILFVLASTISAGSSGWYKCFLRHYSLLLFETAFCYWLVGIATIIFTVIAIVYYRKAGSSEVTYDQFIEDSGTVIKTKEWFICLLLIDCFYAFGHVALSHVFAIFHGEYFTIISAICYLIFNASLACPMYSLSCVRSSIRNGFMWLLGFLRKHRASESHVRMTPSRQVILEAGSMDGNESHEHG